MGLDNSIRRDDRADQQFGVPDSVSSPCSRQLMIVRTDLFRRASARVLQPKTNSFKDSSRRPAVMPASRQPRVAGT